MVRNLEVHGIPNALTGPLTRGDSATIRTHLSALEHYDQDLADLYSRLAVESVLLLLERGLDVGRLNTVLSGSKLDAI
ncbi:MAG: DUF2520 domain-containing protein [Anaerolineae bacterium]